MRRLWPLLLVSCAGIAPPSYAPLDRAPTADEERARPRPATEARSERWILTRGKTEIVFTLLIEFEGGLMFAALDDFGGVLADGTGQHSRIIPASLAQRIGRLLEAKYAPRDLRLVRVGSATGWAAAGALWTANEMYTDGSRVRLLGPTRYEVEGAITATVTIG
jgi:hypothetical protein